MATLVGVHYMHCSVYEVYALGKFVSCYGRLDVRDEA